MFLDSSVVAPRMLPLWSRKLMNPPLTHFSHCKVFIFCSQMSSCPASIDDMNFFDASEFWAGIWVFYCLSVVLLSTTSHKEIGLC